jgi:uncharacterized protein YkwD
MDDHTFDTLIKSFTARAQPRRGAITGLLGAALGLGLVQFARLDGDAKKKKHHKKHKHKKKPQPGGCTPDCSGKDCGGDGCGGSCGTCPDGEDCFDAADSSICQAGQCTPDCAGKECGPNGCGGSCGTCAGDRACHNGTCECATSCGGQCCGAGQTCIGDACWEDSEELAFHALLNNHRAANGLGALSLNNKLGRAAELHSQDQADNNYSDHTGSDGSSPEKRIADAGYSAAYTGENIYWNSGDGSASAAFTWWRNSPNHNANMLSTTFTEFGIGRAQSGTTGYWYWTTTFGKPK